MVDSPQTISTGSKIFDTISGNKGAVIGDVSGSAIVIGLAGSCHVGFRFGAKS